MRQALGQRHRIVFRRCRFLPGNLSEHDAFRQVPAALRIARRHAATFARRVQVRDGFARSAHHLGIRRSLRTTLRGEHRRIHGYAVVGAVAEGAHVL